MSRPGNTPAKKLLSDERFVEAVLELRSERNASAGLYYQFLSGHAAIGSYLHEKIHKVEPSACGWCGSGERGFWYHLIARCKMWAP